MAGVCATDAKARPLAPLGGGEDSAGIRGEEGGQEDPGQTEEEEHPLAHGCVALRHLEGVRDVVDQVVLARRDAVDSLRDRCRLGERARRIRIEPRPVDEHVHLAHRGALDDPSARGAGGLERRDDLALERRRADDRRVRHVDEVLELVGVAAVEEGVGS